MSATLPPHPAMPPSAGAVQGMPNPAQAQQQQMAMKFQTVVKGVQEVIQIIKRIPGVDQAKVEQATQMIGQATHMLADAIPKPGGAAPGGPPPVPGAPG